MLGGYDPSLVPACPGWDEQLAAANRVEKPLDFKITLADGWSRKLFVAPCRRCGLSPFRRRGRRYTTVMVNAPASFVGTVLWPEFNEVNSLLRE
jgi:hypothetical protein